MSMDRDRTSGLGLVVVLAKFICFNLIIGGECILTPVPLIYPAASENDGDNSTDEGDSGWRPSPGFFAPYHNTKIFRTKLGLNVTVPVKRHAHDYTGEYSAYGFRYPPYNGDYDGYWPPVSGPGPGLGPGPGPGPVPVPVPGNGYQNYPPPLAVRPPIQQELLLKSLLVPLTGAALLGVAAFLVSNPVLLKLGVIAGRRRRRSASQPTNHSEKIDQTLTDFRTLQRFMRQLPDEDSTWNRNKMVANYLTCSGLLANSRCLESLACQTALTKQNFSQFEKKVIRIVMDEIMLNTFVSQDVKKRIKRAQNIGRILQNCSNLVCTALDEHSFCSGTALF